MWGIVDSLGLKEGLKEFQDQFNKDAKQTIASTQFAKDRGIDVQRLDELQQDFVEQAQELHENTIGAAVDVLAKDETFGKLLDITSAREEDDVGWGDSDEELSAQDGHCRASGASPSSAAAVGQDRVQMAAPVNSEPPPAAATPSPAAVSTPALPSSATVPAAGPAAAVSSGLARSEQRAPAASERSKARQLEAEVRELSAARTAAESQLSAARNRANELEARWAELSGVSDDALRQAEEARQQVVSLRRSVEEKDSQITKAEDTRWQLANERSSAIKQLEELQANFQERVQREVSQKEQELLDEVSYLKKCGETKDRRLKELTEDKARLDHKVAALNAVGDSSAAREVMLEAHTAIAKAFGDTAIEHPCVRLVDEPLLKFTAMLFKQPIFRRLFFAASAVMWVFSLGHAMAPSTEWAAIHI